jgi:PAS domain S-box-containing protein
MAKKPRAGSTADDLTALREKAEARLREKSVVLSDLPVHDVERLIHEIGTYHIELEMQNDELRRAQEEIEESRRKYADLYDFAPAGYLTLSRNGRILEANQTGARLLGTNKRELLGMLFGIFLDAKSVTKFNSHCKKVFMEAGQHVCDIMVRRKDGIPFPVQLQSIAAEGIECGKEAACCRTIMSDISEIRKAEEALRKSEELFRVALKNSPISVYTIDRELRYTWVYNPHLHFTDKEIFGRRVEEVFPHDSAGELIELKRRVLESGRGDRRNVTAIIRDERHVFDVTVEPLRDQQDQVVGLTVATLDITGRKRTEDELSRYREHLEEMVKERTRELEHSNAELKKEITERTQAEEALRQAEQDLRKSHEQMRSLSAYLQDTIEKERTHIAREMHDELGQILTAVTMDISWIRKKYAGYQPLIKMVNGLSGLIDMATETVHKITAELRPSMLDNIGLKAAIGWQTREFSRRMSAKCRTYITGRNVNLSKSAETAVFRIFQEALTNIARHANAQEVFIRLVVKNRDVVLTVRDDGKGITEQHLSGMKSFGIMGMRERANHIGGTLTIEGIGNRGTTVMLSVPLIEEDKK